MVAEKKRPERVRVGWKLLGELNSISRLYQEQYPDSPRNRAIRGALSGQEIPSIAVVDEAPLRQRVLDFLIEKTKATETRLVKQELEVIRSCPSGKPAELSQYTRLQLGALGTRRRELEAERDRLATPASEVSTPTSTSAAKAKASTPVINGLPAIPTHEERVEKVSRNFHREGKPNFTDFCKALGEPRITDPEFCAWKRGDPKHCGRGKWERLDRGADRLS